MLSFDTYQVRTIGQAVYLATVSNPDGLDSGELVAKLKEINPVYDWEPVLRAATDLLKHGYLRKDDGRWYAPGPKVAVWERL